MRTGYRGGRARLLLLALAVTVAVLAVNSIASSSSKGPDVALAYLDRVRPAVGRSTAQGVEFDELQGRVPELGPIGLGRGLDRIEREAGEARDEVADARPPDGLDDAHTLLVASLTARAAAVGTVKRALGVTLEAAPAEEAVLELVRAGRDLAVADRAYELFLELLPAGHRPVMPPSRWLADGEDWSRGRSAALVSGVRASGATSPVHDLAIVTFTTDPTAVAMEGPNPVLPTVRSLRLSVIVANVGNETAERATVEAVVSSDGGLDTARQFVDLEPGQQVTVPLTVRPSPVGTMMLVVKAIPEEGETSIGDNERSYSFVMR